jgi:hypothetical protein
MNLSSTVTGFISNMSSLSNAMQNISSSLSGSETWTGGNTSTGSGLIEIVQTTIVHRQSTDWLILVMAMGIAYEIYAIFSLGANALKPIRADLKKLHRSTSSRKLDTIEEKKPSPSSSSKKKKNKDSEQGDL